MNELTKKQFFFDDMTGIFATVGGVTQFLLVPKGSEGEVCDEKITGKSPLGHYIDREPLLHIALTGDGYSRDFSSGNTLRNADTAFELKLISQQKTQSDGGMSLISIFENGKGLTARLYQTIYEGCHAIETYLELENRGEPVTVEALPSFNLSGISPFDRMHDPQDIILHKFLSNWSGEGKHYAVPTDRLAFEPSWSGLGLRLEKWSQTGTMPARGQLPFIAVEDKKHGVCWAVTMEAPASWVMETVFRNGNISIGGGRGDFLTAHWRKTLKTGETLRSDKAFVTVVRGGLEEASARLVKEYDRLDRIKPVEEDLPVMYNEYCYTWGTPTREKLCKQLAYAKRFGCKYFIIDDGWFCKDYGSGRCELGDWEVDLSAFPGGLKQFSREVQAYGMRLGVWYEFESVTAGSKVFGEHPEYLLTCNGKPVRHGNGAFLDLRKPEVRAYLKEKVIDNLKENEIGYMKVDYNDNVGLGADGAESYGEGLRGHIEAVLSFFEEIKESLPGLILEICSSGGMRHEPKFLSIADMVSFSDAHENASGVNVACNLHRYMPPRKMQIWATIRDDYTLDDVKFTVAKAMLGRLCLSGNLASKSEEILSEIDRATKFYRLLVPTIKSGKTTTIEDGEIISYLYPKGRTYLVRESFDGTEKIVYTFSVEAPNAAFEIDVGDYHVSSAYNAPCDLRVREGKLTFTAGACKQWGCVILMKKN